MNDRVELGAVDAPRYLQSDRRIIENRPERLDRDAIERFGERWAGLHAGVEVGKGPLGVFTQRDEHRATLDLAHQGGGIGDPHN